MFVNPSCHKYHPSGDECQAINHHAGVLQNGNQADDTSMTNNLKKMRESRKLTLAQLEEMTGISAQQLNRLEKGERRLNEDNMAVIARAFSCKPVDLIAKGRPAALPINSNSLRDAYIIFRQVIRKRTGLSENIEAAFLETIQRIVAAELAEHGHPTLSLVAAENILDSLLREHASKNSDAP